VKGAGLVGVQKTLSPVLKAKALDNRLPDPILGDEHAERVMRRLDPGYDQRRFGTSQLGLAAVVRAKIHDSWARADRRRTARRATGPVEHLSRTSSRQRMRISRASARSSNCRRQVVPSTTNTNCSAPISTYRASMWAVSSGVPPTTTFRV
jgi:hypothetical protein